MEPKYSECAQIIKNSDVLIITSGAGMGVDSGLFSYRGPESFWEAYPFYKNLGMHFMHVSKPERFYIDAKFAWGFCGHRLESFRSTNPNEGFNILQTWIEKLGIDYFVATSNIDGHFQKSGFPKEKIYEVHGSIHHLQCLRPCCEEIWDNKETFSVEPSTMKSDNVPKCKYCDEVARPNTYMFYDYSWIAKRTDAQKQRFESFIEKHKDSLITIIEIGAGTEIPTIRQLGEALLTSHKAKMIRVNLREANVNSPNFSIASRGIDALKTIDKSLSL